MVSFYWMFLVCIRQTPASCYGGMFRVSSVELFSMSLYFSVFPHTPYYTVVDYYIRISNFLHIGPGIGEDYSRFYDFK